MSDEGGEFAKLARGFFGMLVEADPRARAVRDAFAGPSKGGKHAPPQETPRRVRVEVVGCPGCGKQTCICEPVAEATEEPAPDFEAGEVYFDDRDHYEGLEALAALGIAIQSVIGKREP